MFTCPKCSKSIPKWKSILGTVKIECENCGSTLQYTKESKEKIDRMTPIGVAFGVGAAAFVVNFGGFMAVIAAFALLILVVCIVIINIATFEIVEQDKTQPPDNL